MAVKRSLYKKQGKRKPFWEAVVEWFLLTLKKLIVPVLVIWLVGWLWLGGVFTSAQNVTWDYVVEWTKDQGFVVQDVIIEGRNRVSAQKLMTAINISVGDAILSADVNKIQKNIMELTWVDNVKVARHMNGIITIKITERIPFVIWERPGLKPALVDTNGSIVSGVNTDKFKNLLTVRGVDAPRYSVDLMQMVLAEPEVAKFIRAAEWISNRRWDLITSKGMRIILPEKDMGYALARLAKIQTEKNILNQSLYTLDLRSDDRIIIETERGKSRDLIHMTTPSQTGSI